VAMKSADVTPIKGDLQGIVRARRQGVGAAIGLGILSGAGGGGNGCAGVVGHAVVLEKSAHHAGQPLALFGNGCKHPPSKLLLDGRKLGPHPVATQTSPDRPVRVRPQMWAKPRKSKVSGLPSPWALRLAAAKRPNSISLVLSGWSARAYSATRFSRSARNRTASVQGGNPQWAGGRRVLGCSGAATVVPGTRRDERARAARSIGLSSPSPYAAQVISSTPTAASRSSWS
jgi:hypothetical protein